ncbi:hypothetical protein B0H17DRAFT_1151974, partial [Mycena rosella]
NNGILVSSNFRQSAHSPIHVLGCSRKDARGAPHLCGCGDWSRSVDSESNGTAVPKTRQRRQFLSPIPRMPRLRDHAEDPGPSQPIAPPLRFRYSLLHDEEYTMASLGGVQRPSAVRKLELLANFYSAYLGWRFAGGSKLTCLRAQIVGEHAASLGTFNVMGGYRRQMLDEDFGMWRPFRGAGLAFRMILEGPLADDWAREADVDDEVNKVEAGSNTNGNVAGLRKEGRSSSSSSCQSASQPAKLLIVTHKEHG